jgi:hypothetical protein
MSACGSFGYKIGRKQRLMYVHNNADMLWQVLVREIYVLMKHYGSIETLRQAFNNLLEAKNKPCQKAIDKCKIFADSSVSSKSVLDWPCLTLYCQHSFINILESGYFLNNGEKNAPFVFILDFNTNSVKFYGVGMENKIIDYDMATIDNIMEFEDMPTKTYTEIVLEMNTRFENYSKEVEKNDFMIENINNTIKKINELGGDGNVLLKTREMLTDCDWIKKKLEREYRFFYHRLDALNLIDHD